MKVKQRVAEILETLPDDVSWEEMLDALRLDEALEHSLAEASLGHVVSHEELMLRFARCSTNPSK